MHDYVIKWKRFPRYWPFVRRIQWSPVDSLHKGPVTPALIFSLKSTNGYTNRRDADDLGRHRAHYDVTVMDKLSVAYSDYISQKNQGKRPSLASHSRSWIMTLKPGQNGRHFADDIVKRIFMNEKLRSFTQISLKFVPREQQISIGSDNGLVPIRWNKWWFISLTHISDTRPQRVIQCQTVIQTNVYISSTRVHRTNFNCNCQMFSNKKMCWKVSPTMSLCRFLVLFEARKALRTYWKPKLNFNSYFCTELRRVHSGRIFQHHSAHVLSSKRDNFNVLHISVPRHDMNITMTS